jgi:essential nuclear protein 1
MDPQDLALFNQFNPPVFDDPILRPGEPTEEGQSRNLADIILAKIAEQEAAQGGIVIEDHPLEEGPVELPPKVVEVYTKIGMILSRYKSGKLPKAFKIVPTLPPAMQAAVVEIMQPEKWTPHAVYAATRIFVSATSVTAQQFLQTVLLEAVREDIYENKKLNVHLYNALKKSMYKPAAFFKGVLFPMLQTGVCTLREAAIVASVITRVSVPVLHSAAALTRCCDIAAEQMSHNVEAAGATNLVIRSLLEKRYALPYQTIDALVFHFIRFRPQQQDSFGDHGMQDSAYGKLPVIWHQCLLAFAQRYRDEISEEQREALLDLLLMRGHSAIGPEIRRELLAGRGRGVVLPQEDGATGDGGDDTLMA